LESSKVDWRECKSLACSPDIKSRVAYLERLKGLKEEEVKNSSPKVKIRTRTVSSG
jgi:hypothetical protein